MQIPQELTNFINDNENKKLLNNYKFKELYEKLNERAPKDCIGGFTALMYKAGIDPLLYLDEVPKNFLYDDSSVKSVKIPNNINSIGYWAFAYCSGLTSVTIRNSVTSIGDYAFAYCRGLKSVIIPNSVTTIGNGAFDGCSHLASVTIGSGVNSISNFAFWNCNILTSITYKGTVTSWKKIDKGSNWNSGMPESCIIHCTDSDINAYDA